MTGPSFSDCSRDVIAVATNFLAKSAKFVCLLLFIAMTFQNGLEDRNVDEKRLNGSELFLLCEHLVSFHPVVQSLRGKNVYSRRQSIPGLV